MFDRITHDPQVLAGRATLRVLRISVAHVVNLVANGMTPAEIVPVASLDPQISADILELLQGICRRDGVAVVCSLHQVHLAQAYADRIVGLASGRVMIDMDAARFDAQVAAKLYGSVED